MVWYPERVRVSERSSLGRGLLRSSNVRPRSDTSISLLPSLRDWRCDDCVEGLGVVMVNEVTKMGARRSRSDVCMMMTL